MKQPRGYVLIMLMLVIALMGLGLMVAVPVWQTQIQRENEEELIFRGNQYVEALRIFQLKNPGSFPKTLEELVENKCIRRLYKDPMTPGGEWNLILNQEGIGSVGQPRSLTSRGSASSRISPGEGPKGPSFSAQRVMVAPPKALSSIRNPRILGVVSTSTKKSIRVYKEQESYDKWLFFYGQDSTKLPEIIYYGQPAKTP
jgi:type II secretory pathway pseudopilin PulG